MNIKASLYRACFVIEVDVATLTADAVDAAAVVFKPDTIDEPFLTKMIVVV